MATCSRSVRLGLRICARHAAGPQSSFSPPSRVVPAAAAAAASPHNRRCLSSTPCRLARKSKETDEDDEFDESQGWGSEGEGGNKPMSAESQMIAAKMEAMGPQQKRELERLALDMARVRSQANLFSNPLKRNDFWYNGEDDVESWLAEKFEPDEAQGDENDIATPGHAKFEEFREYREYARLAAWQLPLLSKLAKPFVPPTADEPLRFRYTTYMGETHPAENKVVVEFAPRDLPLTEPQQLKLKKLLGPRYNPETEIAKMSCEQFEHQAQNKRYLGDLVDKLIVQAKDTTDTFEDIPLDTRHHKFKPKIKFPLEWRMTAERRKEIDDAREQALLLDAAKAEEGTLVDGKQVIAGAYAMIEQQQRERQRIPLPGGFARGGGGGGKFPARP